MTPYLRTDGPIGGHLPRTEQRAVRTPSGPVVREANPNWREYAACRDEDPELFFPVSIVGPVAQRQVDAAKDVCRRCPVADDCLSWALAADESAGVWGGMAENERRSLKRRVARAEAKQAAS